MAVTKAQQQERLRRNEEKWTSTLMEAGWTVLPSIILERQDALGLDPVDVNRLRTPDLFSANEFRQQIQHVE